MKRLFKKKQAVTKGAKSAVLLSVIIHAGLFFLAGLLVVFTVQQRSEPEFEAVVAKPRPKMKLQKPKVRMRKQSKPKVNRIMTQNTRSAMPQLQLPEMGGSGDGLDSGIGDGLLDIPELGEMSILGSAKSIGNDFEGYFYSLLYDSFNQRREMDGEEFLLILRDFCVDGWKESKLARYYKSSKALYTTHFAVPEVLSPMAPDLFGQREKESYYFFVKYKGKLVYPEDIKFRFWGVGDAYAVVRVDGKNVWVNGVPNRLLVLDFWQTRESESDRYQIGNWLTKAGDWIELKAGEPVDMELLYGEWRGGSVACVLLVEVEGVEYPKNRQGGPIFPAFKTEEFTEDQIEEIESHFSEGEFTLHGGPIFRDYFVETSEEEDEPVVADEAMAEEELVSREETLEEEEHLWTLSDGQTVKGEYIALINGQVTLKTANGRFTKIDRSRFSDEDKERITLMNPPRLNLDFTYKTEQRNFPPWESNQAPPQSFYYNFTTEITKRSSRPYPLELTAEVFVIGKEVDSGNGIVVDYTKQPFTLDTPSGSIFTIESDRIELIRYELRSQSRGEEYKGYLIVVSDARGETIAYDTTNEYLFEHLDKLRKVPEGKRFDKECNRVRRSRPDPYY